VRSPDEEAAYEMDLDEEVGSIVQSASEALKLKPNNGRLGKDGYSLVDLVADNLEIPLSEIRRSLKRLGWL